MGIYNVNYILSVPGVNVFNDKFDFEELVNSGDSLLQMPSGEFLVIHATDRDYKLEIQFLTNEKGILSRVHVRVNCASFEDAERFAHERVCLMLSYWSFLFDIGVDISSYLIVEESTGTRKYLGTRVVGGEVEHPLKLSWVRQVRTLTILRAPSTMMTRLESLRFDSSDW